MAVVVDADGTKKTNHILGGYLFPSYPVLMQSMLTCSSTFLWEAQAQDQEGQDQDLVLYDSQTKCTCHTLPRYHRSNNDMELNVHMFGCTNGNYQSSFHIVGISYPHIRSYHCQISHLVADYW
jgi:hypothetical protein